MDSALQPSRTRHGVIFFAVMLGIIHYIDRVCISSLAPVIQADLGMSKQEMKWVFSAFVVAYALFEIPGGWLGDKWGPRRVLLRIVMFWSVFTAATGAVWNWFSLIVCRFLFGMGEAGGFPNIAKMFSIWLPHRERDVAQGITWMSARWGGALSPLLVLGVSGAVGWRWTFVVFACLGVIWVVFFTRWFRDNPADHPGVNAAELALLEDAKKNMDSHAAIPWKRLLTTRSVLLLWLYYFCISYVWYFYITWMPTYMGEALKMDMKDPMTAVLGGAPLFFGGIGCYAGGVLARRLARRGGGSGISAPRRVVGVLGMLGAGACILVATWQTNPTLVMLAMGVSGFFNDLSMPCAWGAATDIGGKLAGSVSGSMNMMGNFGGALAPLAVVWILDASKNDWNVPLYVAASTYLISALCWVFIDSDERLHS